MKKLIEYIKNYWYYYKVYVITGVLVIAVVLYSFLHAGGEEKFDRNFAVISSQQYSEAQTEGLRQALNAAFGSAGLRVYQIELGALNQEEATLAKLDLDLGQKRSDTLLIEDMDAFRAAVADSVKISEPVRVGDIPGLAGLGFDTLWLVTRE